MQKPEHEEMVEMIDSLRKEAETLKDEIKQTKAEAS